MTLTIGPTTDIATCAALRRAVFTQEQGVPAHIEQDGRDTAAHHLLASHGGSPVGTARLLLSGQTGKIGRVCVLPAHRRQGIGTALLRGCLDHMRGLGLTRAELGAQTYALGFYEALGFTPFGPVFEDAGGQPHRAMARPI